MFMTFKVINYLIFFLLFAVTPHISKAEPSFISRSETFKFVAGDTIKLPCDVANAGK
jgi:hypothetical protein